MDNVEEKKPYTWQDLKDFCTSLSESQLKQSVKIFVADDESPTDVDCAEELGEEHYHFPEHEYSCTKTDFDGSYITDDNDRPLYGTVEEAADKEECFVSAADRVYLHAFL